MRMSIKTWLPALASALIFTSPMAIAAGLTYQDPPADQQRGTQRERPTLLSETQGNVSSDTVTDATGQAQRSTWSAWESDSGRRSERLEFQGGGDVDSTVTPSSMESGRLEWGNDPWSDCKTSASNEYCGTMVSGIRERSVWCQFDRANGQSSTANEGLCLTAQGAKPETTRSCQMEITSDCVYPPIIVTLEGTPQGPYLADGHDSVTLTATVQRTNGEVAIGETVKWATDRGSIQPASRTTTTDSHGRSAIVLRSDSVGRANVSAQTHDSSAQAGVDFVTAEPNFVHLSANPDSGLLANGGDASRVSAVLEYVNGKPASGHTIHYSTSLGHLNASSATTDGSGRADVLLASHEPGYAYITARTSNHQAHTGVTFNEMLVPRLNDIWASPNNGIPANGSEGSTVTANVRNQHGTPVSGELVSFYTSLGWLHQSSAWTDGDGNANVWLTSNETGTARVTASYAGSSLDTYVGFVSFHQPTFRESVGGSYSVTMGVRLDLDGGWNAGVLRPTWASPSDMGGHSIVNIIEYFFGSIAFYNSEVIQDLDFSQFEISIPGGASCTWNVPSSVNFGCSAFDEQAPMHGASGGQFNVTFR